MLAEITVVPIDKSGEGFSSYVARSLTIIKQSGLDYLLTPMSTIVEGESDEVFDLIKKVHMNMVSISDRVSTSIKIDDRKGYSGALKDKVNSVEKLLNSSE